jgi:hypothetical protein
LEISGRGPSGAPIRLEIERHFLSFSKAPQARALKGVGVNENVLSAIIRLDESVTLLAVVPLHCARLHAGYPFASSIEAEVEAQLHLPPVSMFGRKSELARMR